MLALVNEICRREHAFSIFADAVLTPDIDALSTIQCSKSTGCNVRRVLTAYKTKVLTDLQPLRINGT